MGAEFIQFGVDDGIDFGEEAVIAGEFLWRVEKSCRRDVENNAERVQQFCGDERFAVFDSAEVCGNYSKFFRQFSLRKFM